MQNKFMLEALKQAEIAAKNDEVPIGAIIVCDGKIIARAHNNRASNDPTAHAEILALRFAALEKKSSRLDDCDLYITLEPCAMCAAAISLARIKRVFYALDDKKFGAVENGIKFFHSNSCFHRPEIYSDLLSSQSKELLQKFFQQKRN